MITISNLPAEYKPCATVNFCSNMILGGGHIFAIGDALPLLIGAGKTPKIWLQAVVNAERHEFITVVENSKSKNLSVAVNIFGAQLIVTVGGKTVISVESTGADSAAVQEVDFRPLGLNVVGSSSSLSMGGMTVSRNTFANTGVAFKMGM
jgi:hypothetical protein